MSGEKEKERSSEGTTVRVLERCGEGRHFDLLIYLQ
jgi:hypothetical protein